MRKVLTLIVCLLMVSPLVVACRAKEAEAFKVGYVTDTGGIDDMSFNTTQWKGIERAAEELGVEAGSAVVLDLHCIDHAESVASANRFEITHVGRKRIAVVVVEFVRVVDGAVHVLQSCRHPGQ